LPAHNLGVFITGNDTGVGKTWVSINLLQLLQTFSRPLQVYKPVESGCDIENAPVIPQDAELLRRASNTCQSLAEICPYPLQAALSPERAARLQNKTISLGDIYTRCPLKKNYFTLVEGAGGFYSPICSNGLNADLAKHFKLPVIIVVEDKLGCINQALLTYHAVKKYDLKVLAIILNQITPPSHPAMDNDPDLGLQLAQVKRIKIPYNQPASTYLIPLATQINQYYENSRNNEQSN
jgi:dethiobiotin synthetase